MVEPISLVNAETAAQVFEPSKTRTTADFGDWLTQQINGLNQQIVGADTEVRRLALGESGNLHEVMTRLETAKISFELAVQVRNKILEAYQEIIRMQI